MHYRSPRISTSAAHPPSLAVLLHVCLSVCPLRTILSCRLFSLLRWLLDVLVHNRWRDHFDSRTSFRAVFGSKTRQTYLHVESVCTSCELASCFICCGFLLATSFPGRTSLVPHLWTSCSHNCTIALKFSTGHMLLCSTAVEVAERPVKCTDM